jgi:hypothetical protein
LRSSDPPPLPAPEVPVHQHRALDDSQKRFDQVAISGRRAAGVWADARRERVCCEILLGCPLLRRLLLRGW